MQARINGTVMPVLEIDLAPEEAIFAESGELSWMTSSIEMTTGTQYGGGGGGVGILKRAVGGSSIFMTEYQAKGSPGSVSFAAKMPGTIFQIDVGSSPEATYRCHRHGFVCGVHGVELSVGFQQKLGAGVFGGNGFRLQKVSGQGTAWIELSGEIMTYDLAPGEVMRVHPGHVGLFQETVGFDITTVKGIKNKVFGADGIFLARLTGPGRIWLQSLPISRLAQAIAEYIDTDAAATGAAAGTAGGILGNILRNS